MCKIFLTIRKLSPKIISSVNPKYLNNSFMKRSLIISKKQNSNLMIHNANWLKKYKTITRPSNLKTTKLLSCSQHNNKTPKTCYSSQSETRWEKKRGGELTTQ